MLLTRDVNLGVGHTTEINKLSKRRQATVRKASQVPLFGHGIAEKSISQLIMIPISLELTQP